VFTRALHWFLFRARYIQSIPPQYISLRSTLLLSTRLRLDLPSGLFHSGFPTNILHAFLFRPFLLHTLPISSSLTALHRLLTFHLPNPISIFFSLGRFQRIRPGPRPFVTIRNKLIFIWCGVVSPTPDLQAGGPLFVKCARLLIQYIRSYPPYPEAVFSILNLRTRHAMVTRHPANMVYVSTAYETIL
jgi:hypothetical protein